MMRRVASAAVLVILGGVIAVAQGDPSTQRPTFQASSDLVAIDVFVRSGRDVITGLTAADFTVADNGRRQRIERVDAEAMPLDVTLVLDVSGFTGGAWTRNVPAARVLAEAAGKARDIAAVLRPDDRIRVIVSDTDIRMTSQWTDARDIAAPGGDADIVESISTGTAQGLSSIYDALATALMEAVPYGRRHAVVAWAKARDTISTTDETALKEIAYQSDAALHVVLRETGTTRTAQPRAGIGVDVPVRKLPNQPEGNENDEIPSGPDLRSVLPTNEEFTLQSFTHTWRPFARNDPFVLRDAAFVSGGTFRDFGAFSDRDLAAEFRGIFETYRQGYVIRYAPSGVKREGWHDVVVRVPKLPNATIRARRGYAIEGPGAATRSAAPSRSAPLEELVTMFNRRDDVSLQARLRQVRDRRSFIRDYRAGTNPWGANGRLEAIFVLHAGAAGLSSADANTRAEATGLLDRYRELVRSPFALRATHGLAVKSFECRWYGAAFAAFHGALQPSPVLGMADAAIERCPDDGGLRLARAIATDQLASTRTTPLPGERQAPRPPIDEVLARYADAFAFPAVADEARVRAAWAAYRNQNLDTAHELLAQVGPAPADSVVNYFSHFVRAEVLRRRGDRDGAVAEYSAALRVVPLAQAPRVALMTLLTQLGRRSEAEQLADAIETAPATSFDPWWLYWAGDYRTFGARLSELRALAERP